MSLGYIVSDSIWPQERYKVSSLDNHNEYTQFIWPWTKTVKTTDTIKWRVHYWTEITKLIWNVIVQGLSCFKKKTWFRWPKRREHAMRTLYQKWRTGDKYKVWSLIVIHCALLMFRSFHQANHFDTYFSDHISQNLRTTEYTHRVIRSHRVTDVPTNVLADISPWRLPKVRAIRVFQN